MNNILKISMVVTTAFISISNIHSQCESIDYNNALTKVSNNYRSYTISVPGIFEDKADIRDIHYFEGVDNPVAYMGYTKGLWMGGLDLSNNLMLSAATYADGNQNDFYPGPFHYDIEAMGTCDIFNRVWLISKAEITILKDSFKENGQLDANEIPRDILEWPAKGNPYFPGYGIENFMAPFQDENNDGIYNPFDGDLPVVYDENVNFIPFLFGFRVFNNNGIHLESQGYPPIMEFHHTFYMTNCEELGPSNNSIFHRVKLIYKGLQTLKEFKIGLFEDQDLGCYFNDYLGVDTFHKAAFVYNENGIDEGPNFCPPNPIPQDYSVIRSTKFLNRYVEKFTYFVNGGTGGPFSITDPQSPYDYYNYLSGLQKDGSPYTFGGNGLDPFGTPVDHVFTDYPNQADGWSMQNNIAKNDYRSVTTFWEGDILPGQIVIADFADHVYLDSINKGLSSFNEWPKVMEQLQQEYYQFTDEYNISQCASSYQICSNDCVWPGEVNKDFIVNYKDIVQLGTLIHSANETGPSRSVISKQWFGFEAEEWNQFVGDLNFKYGDCNGSGRINEIDLEAIEDNYDKTTPSYMQSFDDLDIIPDEVISISFLEDSLDGSFGSTIFDRILNLRVILGEPGSSLQKNIHGLGFVFQVDTSKFLSLADEIGSSNTFTYSFNNASFSPSDSQGLLSIDNDKIDCGYSNLNNNSLQDADELLRHLFVLKENLTTSNPNGRDTVSFKINNVYALNEIGDTVYIDNLTASIPLYGLVYDPTTSILEIGTKKFILDIYPNPVEDILNIESFADASIQGEIINAAGIKLGQFKLEPSCKIRYETNELAPGIYFLVLRDELGNLSTNKFIKI